MDYKPPYTITTKIVNLVAKITECAVRLSIQKEADLRLRKVNRIQTIQGSLAIEGNTLSTEQVTAILDGKHIVAPIKEIQEVRNAIKAYDKFLDWNPFDVADLLDAHRTMTEGLIDQCGMFRTGGVGVVANTEVIHVAPPADRVPYLIKDLFAWLEQTDEHPLIASSVFHYEFEFIHPFADGNGRIGRLWQTLLLSRWNSQFAYLPVENMVYQKQFAYYDAINESSYRTDCSPFIEFMLEVIYQTVSAITPEATPHVTPEVERLLRALRHMPLGKQEILQALGLKDEKNLRELYIKPALQSGLIELTIPDKPKSPKQQYRLTEKGKLV